MDDNHSHSTLYEKTPLYQLFASLVIVLGAGILLFIIFLGAGIFIFDTDIRVLENPSLAVGGKDIAFLKYILISQQISFFIVPALIILNKLKPGHLAGLMDMKMPRINEIALVVVLAFCLFPITGFTGELNSTMHFPDWFSGVGQWMIEKEDSAARLLDTIMAPDTFWAMILNLLMIAVLPAIGEELIFRGVFQKNLSKLFRSGHLAIWVTAFLFSAIHLQFFGFVPRFILGLVFGYLFFWSGTLWLPVIAHFVNNAVPVLGAFIFGWNKVNTPSDIPLWKQMIVLPLPVLISIAILLYFRNKSKTVAELSTNKYQI
jgi:membrane protease YdiL (CAAX protease family)